MWEGIGDSRQGYGTNALDSFINMFADDAEILREVKHYEDCNNVHRDLEKAPKSL